MVRFTSHARDSSQGFQRTRSGRFRGERFIQRPAVYSAGAQRTYDVGLVVSKGYDLYPGSGETGSQLQLFS